MGAVLMMSALVLIAAGAVALAAWIFKTVAAKLIAEDVRAMVDDLPGVTSCYLRTLVFHCLSWCSRFKARNSDNSASPRVCVALRRIPALFRG